MASERPPADNAWGADPDEVLLPNQPYRIDFVMLPGSTVVGHLYSEANRLMDGKTIYLAGPEMLPSTNVFASAETDAAGQFTFKDVPRKEFWFQLDDLKSGSVDFTSPGRYELELRLDGDKLTCEINAEPFVGPGLMNLGYGDGTADGKKSLGASGHATQFRWPMLPAYVESVEIVAARYGAEEPPAEDFHLYILNAERQILADVRYPYSVIDRGELKSYTLHTPFVEIPRDFCVALAFNPDQTKGIYLGYDEDVEKSHSLRGLPDSGYEPVDGKYDWMIKPQVFIEPAGDRPVMRLADWKPPVATNPFAGMIEVAFDDGQSDGRQSYGGAGPAIVFDCNEVKPHYASDAIDLTPLFEKSVKNFESKKLELIGFRVFGSRYGSGYDVESPIEVAIQNYFSDSSNFSVPIQTKVQFPYDLFTYNEQWVNLVLPEPLELKGDRLSVQFDPQAHQTKGIYFHYNKDPKTSHSFRAGPETLEALPDREWMIRAYFKAVE